MEEKTHAQQAIVCLYFAFTSLSTVGLGDYVPKNDYERLIVVIILLFGVSIYTYLMNKFIEIIT